MPDISIDLQPLILLRTDVNAASTAADLELGGYVVCKAPTDEMTLWMLRSVQPEAIVIDAGWRETEKTLAKIESVACPVLVLSPLPDAFRRRFPHVSVLRARLERYELIDMVDRLLIDTFSDVRGLATVAYS